MRRKWNLGCLPFIKKFRKFWLEILVEDTLRAEALRSSYLGRSKGRSKGLCSQGRSKNGTCRFSSYNVKQGQNSRNL